MKPVKIPEHLYPYFEQAGMKKQYQKQQVIYMQGDQASTMYLITKGRVRVYYISSDGKENTIEIIEKGRIFGESSFSQNASRPTTVIAVNEVRVISTSLQQLLPYLSSNEELMLLLFQHLSNTLDHLSMLVNQAHLCNRHEKVATFLLHQTAIPDKDKGIVQNTIPYTHEEIALYLGLHRVTVTNILHEFQELGWIRLSYRKVIVLQRNALLQYLQQDPSAKKFL